jgi:hypothetical protein
MLKLNCLHRPLRKKQDQRQLQQEQLPTPLQW